MISIAAIQDKLNKKIFEEDSSDPFILQYYKREKSIKFSIRKAFRYLEEHAKTPGIIGELNYWQKSKVDRNVENLIKYIEKLYLKLDKEIIIEYCKNYDPISPILIEEFDLIFMINSYYGNVLLDILWASDISVSDVLNIAEGKIDNKNLARKLPDKIKLIKKEIIPFIKIQKDYSEYISPITESIDAYKRKIYKGASLLVIVAIEGMVRKLGNELIKSQNLDVSYINTKYHSLDSYLRKVPWKKDFKIEKSRLMFITGDYEFKDETKNTKEDEYEFINLKTRLDFLRRTFKRERDLTLHGNVKLIGETWDLYRNYSALNEVYLTLKYYSKLYPHNNEK